MNMITLIGNLTRDPEMRVTQSGANICSFGVAVNRRRKVEGQPEADFFNISVLGVQGENCKKYLTKGRKVCVVGNLQGRLYTGQDGVARISLDVFANDVEFLPNASQPMGSDYVASAPAAAAAPSPAPAASYGATPPPPRSNPPMEKGFSQVEEDELPF